MKHCSTLVTLCWCSLVVLLLWIPPGIHSESRLGNTTEDDFKLVIMPNPGSENKISMATGEKRMITCKGEGPTPEALSDIKWYWPDGQEIRDTDPTRVSLQSHPKEPSFLALVFNSFSERDAGTYRCTATYAKTKHLEVTIQLASYVPITFEDANENQYATKGELYKVLCRVKSNPPPVVTWTKDHLPISNSENYVIEADGLVIKNVSDGDEGMYTCTVFVYSLGHTKDRYITVQVQEKPRIVYLLKEMEGSEGKTVHLQCSGEGKPKPEIEWLHRGQPLYGIPRHTVDKYVGTLQIDNLQVEDQGEYKCIVKNNAGHDERSLELIVVTQPVIEEFLNVTTQVKNREVFLTCRASGNPAPSIVFQKDSMNQPYVPGSQKDFRIFQDQRNEHGVTIGTLRITDILRTDDGLYKCIASNGRLTTERLGHLTVEFPPTFDRSPQREAWAWAGSPANQTCFAEAIPNATIAWHRNEHPVLESHKLIIIGRESESTLQLRPENRDDFGTYTCVATNKLGVATHGIYFKEAARPGRIQQVILQRVTATTVSFRVAGPVNDGGLPVHSFAVQYRFGDYRNNFSEPQIIPITENLIIFENLAPLTSYTFRFAAKNDAGMGEFTEQTQVTSKRSAPEPPVILTGDGQTETPISLPDADHAEIKWTNPQDNGEPVKEFEVSYIPVRHSNTKVWETAGTEEKLIILAPQLHCHLPNLKANTFYRVEVRATNILGTGNPSQIYVKTPSQLRPAHPGNPPHSSPTKATLDIPLIIVAAVIVLLLTLILVDFACCRISKCGILFTISTRLCNKKKQDAGASAKLSANGEKYPLPDLESMDRFHNPSDLDDIPPHHAVSQPLIKDTKANGNGTSSSPANTFV